MASQVTIIGPSARRHVVKTTPSMYLNDIMAEACTKFRLNAQQYGLKNNNKIVDLSRTMRLSGLTPGAKLELTLLSRSPSIVSVALQLPAAEASGVPNGRILDKFPSTTTLWMILRQFEAGVAGQAGQARNFTARGTPQLGVGNSGSGRLYHEFPILQIMGREYTTLTDLQKTLGQLGFNNGSVLLRLSFKATDIPLEAAMEQADRYFKSVEGDNAKAIAPPESIPEAAASVRSQEDVSMVDQAVGLTSQAPSTEKDGKERSDNIQPPEDREASAIEASATMSSGPEEIPGVSKRPTSVYAPPASTIPQAAQMSHNPADYVPTVDHAKSHQATLSKAGLNKRLPTDAEVAAQEAAEAEKLATVHEVSIKIRYPDQSSVVASFSGSDTAEDLFAYTRSLMARDNEPFGLQYASKNGAKMLRMGKEKLIADLGMLNRVLVVVVWEDGASTEARKGRSLKEEVMKKQQQIEVKNFQGAESNESEDVIQPKKESESKGKEKGKGSVPKWLKLPGKK